MRLAVAAALVVLRAAAAPNATESRPRELQSCSSSAPLANYDRQGDDFSVVVSRLD